MAASTPSPFIFFFLLLLLSVSHASHCNRRDYAALTALKKSFNYPTSLSTWTNSTPCCRWPGIRCDDDISARGRVTKLTIEDTNTTATISPSISLLDKLRDLTITRNSNLTGSIPSSIGNLKDLTIITITYNPLLTGPIPESFCSLPKLDGLIMFNNDLTGRLPGCLGGKLASINLASNRLSGAIPDMFLSNRTTNEPVLYFGVYGNNFTGPIPKSMGDVDFIQIDIVQNGFTDASVLFGEEKKAVNMDLNNNRLEFDFAKVKFPLTLQQLSMGHNRVFGSIPKQITKLKNLTYFDVSYNQLCGEIPTGGPMGGLSKDSYAHNKCLCGTPLEPCH